MNLYIDEENSVKISFINHTYYMYEIQNAKLF